MNFASDNTTGAAPEILAALVEANDGRHLPYGDDAYTREVERRFSELFETEVGVLLVSTGTAANALAFACSVPPYGAIFCRRGAHIEASEAGAVEHLTGGARLVPIDAPDGKLTAITLDAAIAGYDPAARFHQPAAVSLTQASELGTVYTVEETAELAAVAHRHGLRLHVDGARWANAVAALGTSPAEASWRAGVDVLSFGATKNGALAAEAVVFFDRALMAGSAALRKRAGMLWSKHRFLAVQWLAYLRDELWRELAGRANARAAALARGLAACPHARLVHPIEANEVFVQLPEPVIYSLEQKGFQFYRRGGGVIRLVTAFSTTEEDVDLFVAAAGRLHLSASDTEQTEPGHGTTTDEWRRPEGHFAVTAVARSPIGPKGSEAAFHRLAERQRRSASASEAQ